MTLRRGVGSGLVLVSCLAACAPDKGISGVPYSVVGDAIPDALDGKAGDTTRGRDVFVDRDGGHCLLCHRVASLDEPFHGTLGPDLSAVGALYSPGQIRLRIVNAGHLNPATVMPAYYRLDGLNQVGKAYAGSTALTAQQIEDLVAYLATLNENAISD